MELAAPFPLAYAYVRDPAAAFALIFALIGVYLLIWLIARDTVENDWLRAFGIAVIGIIAASAPTWWQDQGMLTFAGVLAFGAFAVWIVCGWLYDMEIWQRLVTSLVTPPIGLLAFKGGVLLRQAIFGW